MALLFFTMFVIQCFTKFQFSIHHAFRLPNNKTKGYVKHLSRNFVSEERFVCGWKLTYEFLVEWSTRQTWDIRNRV